MLAGATAMNASSSERRDSVTTPSRISTGSRAQHRRQYRPDRALDRRAQLRDAEIVGRRTRPDEQFAAGLTVVAIQPDPAAGLEADVAVAAADGHLAGALPRRRGASIDLRAARHGQIATGSQQNRAAACRLRIDPAGNREVAAARRQGDLFSLDRLARVDRQVAGKRLDGAPRVEAAGIQLPVERRPAGERTGGQREAAAARRGRPGPDQVARQADDATAENAEGAGTGRAIAGRNVHPGTGEEVHAAIAAHHFHGAPGDIDHRSGQVQPPAGDIDRAVHAQLHAVIRCQPHAARREDEPGVGVDAPGADVQRGPDGGGDDYRGGCRRRRQPHRAAGRHDLQL